MCPAPPACSVPGPKYRGPLHCLATVAREEGLRGLYKGSSALLFRDGHSFATYFLSYAILCEQLTPTGHSQPGERGPGPGERGRGSRRGCGRARSGRHGASRGGNVRAQRTGSRDGPAVWLCTGHIGGARPGLRSGVPAWPPLCPRLACG
ncbi:solute carrier family 25 member 47 isoform X1 [Mirounga angustirostris]|nr:solute carrier family 25 member 47-like [Mirounga angustirostris]